MEMYEIKLLTTVGTSIHGSKGTEKYNLERLSDSEFSIHNYTRNFKNENTQFVVTQFLNQNQSNTKICAEIASIDKFYKQNIVANSQKLTVHLICTDTERSAAAAWIIKEWFDLNKETYPELTILYEDIIGNEINRNSIIENLRVTDNEETLEKGISNLFERIKEITYIIQDKDTKKAKTIILSDVVINVTGGYKGIIPYLSIMATIHKWRLIYMYEESKSNHLPSMPLIEIADMPVSFDISIAEQYFVLLESFLLNNTKNLKENELIYEQLIQWKLLNKNNKGKMEITALGTMFKHYVESQSAYSHSSSLGFILEYKLLEYLNSKPIGNYIKITRSTKILDENKKTQAEIDIWLENDLQEVICIEVKPINAILGRSDNLIKQIKKHIIQVNEQMPNKTIKGYYLFVYSIINNGEFLMNKNLPTISENVTSMKNSMNAPIEFKYGYYNIRLDKKVNKSKSKINNIYERFIQSKIEPFQFKTI